MGQSGSLFNAIRAPVSLPLFFTPFDYNGTKLIDGVLNLVPIAPTFNDNTDLIIAVSLGGEVIEKQKDMGQIPGKAENSLSFQQSFMKIIYPFQKENKNPKT